MSQDFISLTFTDEQLTGAATGLDQMELALSWLRATPAAERGNLLCMGAKSEVFCRRTLRVMQANPHIVPPSLAEDLAGAGAAAAAKRTPIATPDDSPELPHLHNPSTYSNVC